MLCRAALTLFLFTLAGWLAARSHPTGVTALGLLALVAVALGGQSIWALRVHQATTYFTGMLTKAINAAASAQHGIGTSIRQIGALLAGAITSSAMMHALRPATPAVPLVLLGAATIVHIRVKHHSSTQQATTEKQRRAITGVFDVLVGLPRTARPGSSATEQEPAVTHEQKPQPP